MGSPCAPLAPARRSFQLQTADAVCHQKTRRPSSRVPPSVQGGRLPSFFLYRKKKEAKKRLPPEGVPPSAEGDRGALPPRLPCKPLKRLDRNFTGLRPQWKKRALPPSSPGGQGGTWGDWSPREAQRSPSGLPGPSAEGPCAGRVGRDSRMFTTQKGAPFGAPFSYFFPLYRKLLPLRKVFRQAEAPPCPGRGCGCGKIRSAPPGT